MRHTETRIYQRSLRLVVICQEVVAGLPVGQGYLADQIRRASCSVVLNFAEGSGKVGARERRRFFGIAKGSANEVGAALDVAAAWGAISPELHHEGADVADHVAAMLTRYR